MIIIIWSTKKRTCQIVLVDQRENRKKTKREISTWTLLEI